MPLETRDEPSIHGIGSIPDDGIINRVRSFSGPMACFYGGKGGGSGTAFKLFPPATEGGPWTEKILVDVDVVGADDAAYAIGAVVPGKNGVLYGASSLGGGQNSPGLPWSARLPKAYAPHHIRPCRPLRRSK
jgi:hypothetical protein